jgi:hypothetical protein
MHSGGQMTGHGRVQRAWLPPSAFCVFLVSLAINWLASSEFWLKACSSGRYFDGSSCQDCAAGFFKDDIGPEACSPCEAGTFSREGASMCQMCREGTVAERKGSKACHACRSGYFAFNRQECKSCPSNSVADEGSSSCTFCMQGSMPDSTKSTCICSPGWTVNAAAAAWMSHPKCNMCPQNTHKSDSGPGPCVPCSEGW